MGKDRYTIKTACPQCGCSSLTNLSEEEIRERYGDIPNAQMECSECMEKYEVEMAKACPEWDEKCRMEK